MKITKCLVVLLHVVLSLCLTGNVFAAVSINETFMNASAPGWTLLGNAALTGNGVIDAAGSGWLRLTSNAGGEAGSAIYNTAFSSDDGVTVAFTYATYGGSGADGFTFYLIDGDTTSPTVGATGGALGYSLVTQSSAPGVTNGFVGIGFDEFGNFSSTIVGACNPSCPGTLPNSITIRGSGSLNTGFNFLTRVAATIGTANRAGAVPVIITVVNNKITVVHNGVTVVNQLDLSTAIGQSATPRTFKMGFSASTGGFTNFHEIRGLNVVSIKTSSTTALGAAPNPSTVGQSVVLTATVTPAIATGNVTFMDGITTLGTAAVSGGVASFNTASLTAGTHPITAIYTGDTNYGISSSPVVNQVVNVATTPISVPTINEWGMILFMLMAGFGSAYYLKKSGRV